MHRTYGYGMWGVVAFSVGLFLSFILSFPGKGGVFDAYPYQSQGPLSGRGSG